MIFIALLGCLILAAEIRVQIARYLLRTPIAAGMLGLFIDRFAPLEMDRKKVFIA